jgi:hypothetical protein
VARLLAFLAAKSAVSAGATEADTGPYCKARRRLPEGLVSRLAREAGAGLHRRYPAGLLLGGRPVKVADGTTVSMPDTPQNQREYPQPGTQKAGLGFPIARVVAVMSLHCAAVLDVAVGPYAGKQNGETALLRGLLAAGRGAPEGGAPEGGAPEGGAPEGGAPEGGAPEGGALEPGDVLLADRYYASFWLIATLLARGVDSLFRQHHGRKVDFRTGTRLGPDDHLVTLRRPQRPAWMGKAEYAALPSELTAREVRVRVAARGFRVKVVVLVTTLLDAAAYSKDEIARAFRCRWHVELDLRAIKQTMAMDVLRCRTPQMARKEVWMHLLAYNLVRAVMAEAAAGAGAPPRELSFAGAVQTITAFAPLLQLADPSDLPRLWAILLRAIARHRVGNRPDRFEPRAVKRRPKSTPWLSVPRDAARQRLARAAG